MSGSYMAIFNRLFVCVCGSIPAVRGHGYTRGDLDAVAAGKAVFLAGLM